MSMVSRKRDYLQIKRNPLATNKHAIIRYHALDRCFGNLGRLFYIEDLVEACNKAIYDHTGKEEGVKKRQVYEDIVFMKSEAGWPLILSGKKKVVAFHTDILIHPTHLEKRALTTLKKRRFKKY